jgi:hypothetical protein
MTNVLHLGSNSRVINNISGGVNGRQVIFVLDIDDVNEPGGVNFWNYFAKNGTGIYIPNSGMLQSNTLYDTSLNYQ